MITIIPSLEVMKANVDNNIHGDGAVLRRVAFDTATDLMSLSSIGVLIEGILYDRLKHKLNDDHKTFFESIYRIDNSAKDVENYNIIQAIKWIAKSESNSKKVIILSENYEDYKSVCNDCIKCLNPTKFIDLVEKAKILHRRKAFSTLDDSLMAVLFIFDK